MKVIEHLERARGPLISFEIIPPLRGGDLQSLVRLVEALARHRPPFIDITSHAAEVIYEDSSGGIRRRVKRKRPGTLGVCALIQNKYETDAVPHVLCQGFTREETEDFLIELRYLGIDNVLAIRGDDNGYVKPLDYGRSRNEYAVDLIRQISAMNRGEYLAELVDADPTDFCVGAAAYPEKHFEAPNLESDLRWACEKVRAGAAYLVTQMFFDNRHYFDFVAKAREIGLEVPIIPGLKVITRRAHLQSVPRTFYCEVPPALADAITSAKPQQVEDVGVEWALAQARGLLDRGAPGVHWYVMQNSSAIDRVLERLDS